MKQILERQEQGWVNFGKVDQYYLHAYDWYLGRTGKIWEIDHKGEKKLVTIYDLQDHCWENENRNATLNDIKNHVNNGHHSSMTTNDWISEGFFWLID